MKTLFLGAYGFGNLGDELCLIESLERFKSQEPWIRTVDPEWTAKAIGSTNFLPWPPSRPPPDMEILFDRVVVGGGGIFYGESLLDFMHWIVAAQNSGAETYVHNVAVAGFRTLDWLVPEVVEGFRRLKGFSVRDRASVEVVESWGLGISPTITPFPERDVAADPLLTRLLPNKPLLGISITKDPAMRAALTRSAGEVREWLHARRHFTVVPVVSVVHRDSAEDDIDGFEWFAAHFLDGFDLVLPEMLDRGWWRSTVTPRNLKGVIGSCTVVLSQRKHNCVHAIGSRVPVVGLNPKEDDSLRRVFSSLQEWLHPESALLPL